MAKGLPKSIIKKYGISKKAWSVYRGKFGVFIGANCADVKGVCVISLVQGYQIQKRKGERENWEEERKGVEAEKVCNKQCLSICGSVLWLLLVR